MGFIKRLFAPRNAVFAALGGRVVSIKSGHARTRIKLALPDGIVYQRFVLKCRVKAGQELKPGAILGTF